MTPKELGNMPADEERKLTLSDIAGYIPYGLYRVNNLYRHKIEIVNRLNNGINELIDSSDIYKPVLRPRSDMYRIITHNGKEIQPIAVLEFMSNTWDFGEDSFSCDTEYDMSFCHQLSKAPEYIDYLNSLFIDYRGLLDAGLAIDANTLESNPYK